MYTLVFVPQKEHAYARVWSIIGPRRPLFESTYSKNGVYRRRYYLKNLNAVYNGVR